MQPSIRTAFLLTLTTADFKDESSHQISETQPNRFIRFALAGRKELYANAAAGLRKEELPLNLYQRL